MKIKSAISIMIVSMLMLTTIGFAQKGQQRGKKQHKNEIRNGERMNGERMFNRIPDITEAQKDQIKKLRTKMMKDMLPLRNELREKKAHLRTLSTAEKADMKAINKQIEEIGVVKVKMMKIRAEMRQNIRALLTDDQRIFFDTHANKMGKKGNGHHGYHKGNGNGNGHRGGNGMK